MSQPKVSDLKEALIKRYHVDPKDLQGKKKAELQEMLDAQDALGSVIEDGDVVMESEDLTDEKPVFASVAWSDWVIKQLEEDEIVEGHPKVDGLRRIATLLFATPETPMMYDAQVVGVPNENNKWGASVVVSVFIEGHGKFTGAGNADARNTNPPFDRYPVSLAETRAEGRALKKLLGLKDVYTADEVTNDEGYSNSDVEASKVIDPQMLTGIKTMASRANISLVKLAAYMQIDCDNDVSKLTKDQALTISEKINELRKGEIPEEVKE